MPGETLILYLAAATEAISTVLLTERTQSPTVNGLQAENVINTPRKSTSTWTRFTNGAPSIKGSSVGLILTDPNGQEVTYALRFNFKAFNNEAEYKALVVGLELAIQMKAQCLEVYTDSLLIGNQVKGLYEVWEDIMRRYLVKFQELQGHFNNFTITKIPRSKNKRTDTLRPVQADYVLHEAHLGSCGAHTGQRSIAHKAARLDYYWPTMYRDATRDLSLATMESNLKTIFSGNGARNWKSSKNSHQSPTHKQTDRLRVRLAVLLFGVLGCEMNKPPECMPPRSAKPRMKGFKRHVGEMTFLLKITFQLNIILLLVYDSNLSCKVRLVVMLFGVLSCEMNKPPERIPLRSAKPGMKSFKRRLSITVSVLKRRHYKNDLKAKKIPTVGDPFGQPPDIGGLDDHVMVDELVSSGNDQPAFVSAGIYAGTAHTTAEGTAAPSWLEACYESLLVAYQDLQTQVATVHKEKNDVELKCNELQGMVLHRDGNIKLFSRELDRVLNKRGEF
ncbi:reverse transcriptase domain-containing protein [Tanacetum coccineum]